MGWDLDFFLTRKRASLVLDVGVMVGTQKDGSVGFECFSSSSAFRALARSSSAALSSASSSRANFRFGRGRDAFSTSAEFAGALPGSPAASPTVPPDRDQAAERPCWVRSKSTMDRSFSSACLRASSSAAAFTSLFLTLSARLISCFWARILLNAHSRQKISP